jgi:hypothetical protein
VVKLEKDLMSKISKRLDLYRFTGEVCWYSRLQCGKIRVGSYFVKMCDKGTPDWLALVRNREDRLTALFIEAKSDSGCLRKEQSEFISTNTKHDIHILVCTDISQLITWIDKNAKDFVDLLPVDLKDINTAR